MDNLQAKTLTATIDGGHLKRHLEAEFSDQAYEILEEQVEHLEDIDTVSLDVSTYDFNTETWDFTITGEVTYSIYDPSTGLTHVSGVCPTCGQEY